VEKEIIQGATPGFRARGRPKTTWLDNIKTWIGRPVAHLIRTEEDRERNCTRLFVMRSTLGPRMDEEDVN